MESLELREEIKRGNVTYFLQTSFIADKKQIKSSFFRNGSVFDTSIRVFDEVPGRERLRELTKEIHSGNKGRFRFILDIRDRMREQNEPGPHVKIAQALLARNLFIEAIAEAEIALGKGAVDSAPWIVKGEAWYRLGESDKAYEAINRGIELSPDYPDLHNLLGRIYLRKKMCREAVESFERAVSLNLYYGEPYINLIKAFLLNSIIKQDYDISKGLKKKFEENLASAVQLNPFLDSEKIERVRSLFDSEAYEDALKVLDSIEEEGSLNPVDEIILELYLKLLGSGENLRDEEIEAYIGRIEEVIDRNPTFADAYNSLGILYTAKCKILMDRASGAFEKAVDINPDYDKANKNQRLTENDRQGVFILLKALLD